MRTGRAVELEPGAAYRHLSLGLALRSLGRHDEAAAVCNRAVDLSPTNARAYGCLGLVALAQGQINRAIPLFERALELDPRYPTAAAQLGWIASRRGDDARAAPLFEVAISADRDPARLAQYRQALGWSYLRLGRGPLAREQFTQALRLDPSLQSAREGARRPGTGPGRPALARGPRPYRAARQRSRHPRCDVSHGAPIAVAPGWYTRGASTER